MRRTIVLQVTFKPKEWELLEPLFQDYIENAKAHSKADFVRTILKEWALSHPLPMRTVPQNYNY